MSEYENDTPPTELYLQFYIDPVLPDDEPVVAHPEEWTWSSSRVHRDDVKYVLQVKLDNAKADIEHLRKKAEFDMPQEMQGRFHNGNCPDPCDMIDGPCACGAWHSAKEWIGKLVKRVEQLQINQEDKTDV